MSRDFEGAVTIPTWTAGSLHSSMGSTTHLSIMLTNAEGHSAASALVRLLIACSSMLLASTEIQLQESGEADESIKLFHSVDTVPWRIGGRPGLPCWRRKGSIVSVRIQMLVRKP